MFPRGGGIWDQNPILIRDFRVIRKFELEWKNDQAEISEAASQRVSVPHPDEYRSSLPGPAPRGAAGLGQVMDQYLQHLEEDGAF